MSEPTDEELAIQQNINVHNGLAAVMLSAKNLEAAAEYAILTKGASKRAAIRVLQEAARETHQILDIIENIDLGEDES